MEEPRWMWPRSILHFFLYYGPQTRYAAECRAQGESKKRDSFFVTLFIFQLKEKKLAGFLSNDRATAHRFSCFILVVLFKSNFISWRWCTVLFYQFFEYHKNIFNVLAIAFYFLFKLGKLQ